MMKKKLIHNNRIVYILLTIMLILLLLSMYQVDRQWSKLVQMEGRFSEQSQDLRALRLTLSSLQNSLISQQNAAPRVTTVASSANSNDNASNDIIPEAFKRAYTASQQADYAQGDWKVGAFGGNIKTITPLVSSDADASEVQSYVLESLLTRNPDTLQWSGLLAKTWQISDDGLVITFQLRPNITFSDGQALTAADIAFTFDFIMNQKIRAPRERAYFEKIKSVKATGTHEVVFTYKEPYFEALELAGGMSILAKHFYAPYLDNPEAFNQSKGLLLGSGPYRLADAKNWRPDKGMIELQRNNRYWAVVQAPYEKILWKVIQNASARLTTYRNGDIDSYGARPIEYEKLKNDPQIKAKSQNFEYMNSVASYSYIAWNQLNQGQATRFADKRVRQAMTYLSNRERIIKDIFLGYAEIAVSPFSPTSKQHDKNIQARAFDIAKAQALLAEAGYQDRDGDGLIEDEQGKIFEFNLVYFQDNEDTKRMVLLLKDIYAKAGIKLIPSPQEWPVMLDMIDKKNFDAITLAWTSGIETDIYQMFHGSQSKTNGDNFINFKNAQLDQLIDQARTIMDEEARMKVWQQAEQVLFEEQPYTFLMRRKTLAFIDQRIKNLAVTKIGLNRGMLPLETYVPRNLQKYQQ